MEPIVAASKTLTREQRIERARKAGEVSRSPETYAKIVAARLPEVSPETRARLQAALESAPQSVAA